MLKCKQKKLNKCKKPKHLHTQNMNMNMSISMGTSAWYANQNVNEDSKTELQAENYRLIMGSIWDFQHLYRYHIHTCIQTNSQCLQMLTVVVGIVQFYSRTQRAFAKITIIAQMHICTAKQTYEYSALIRGKEEKGTRVNILFLYL